MDCGVSEQIVGGILTEQAIDIVNIGVDQEQIRHLVKQVELAENDFVKQCFYSVILAPMQIPYLVQKSKSPLC